MDSTDHGGESSMSLHVGISARDVWTVLDLAGEVDMFSAPKLRDHLVEVIDQGRTKIVLDLEDVSFMDSAGLGVLIGGLRRVREHEGEIALVCTNRPVLRVLTITGLHNVFNLYGTVEEATKADKGN